MANLVLNSSSSHLSPSKRKEMNKFRRDSMSLNFDQGPSSKKQQLYNQSIFDILTPNYKENSLNTPDVNKCVLSSPETAQVTRNFNLQSTSQILSPGLLSPGLFHFALPHFSPNLYSPNLHSPRLSKLIDQFGDPNLNNTLTNSPNHNSSFTHLNGNFHNNFDRLNSIQNQKTEMIIDDEQTDRQPTNDLQIDEETIIDISDNAEISSKVDENSTSFVEMDLENKQKSKEASNKDDSMCDSNQSNLVNKSINQSSDQMDKKTISSICASANQSKMISTATRPTDISIPVNNSINSIHQKTENQSINFPNHIANDPTNCTQSNNQILCLPRMNPHQFNNFVTTNHIHHPLPMQSGYFFNQNGYTINNQVNHIYNNQPNLLDPLNRPISQSQPLGFNSAQNIDKSRKSTSSVNSNNSQLSNSSSQKSETDSSVKVEDKKAKNRAAASRCRKRKQDRVNYLEEQVKFLSADNMRLSRSCRLLDDQNNQLRQQLNLHTSNGCNLIGLSKYSMISK